LNVYYENIVVNGSAGWYTNVDHSYVRTELPSPLIVGSDISTHQAGAGTWLSINGTVVANGTTTQSFTYSDSAGNTYDRHVSATNSSITADTQSGSLAAVWPWPWPFGGSSVVPPGGSGAHGQFAGRLLDQKAHGPTSVW